MKQDNIFFDLSMLSGLGEHTIVGKTVRIRKPGRVAIGDYSIIDDFTYVSCGLTVGLYSHIGANSVLIGGDAHITIGNFVNIAPGCRLIASSHDFAQGGLTGPTIPAEYAAPAITSNISLADHVLLGTGTVVLPGVQLPEGVSTGAMTLITTRTKLEPWTLYVGSPARPLRRREEEAIKLTAEKLLEQYKQK